MKLTPKQLYCLAALNDGELASFQIARKARDDGLNKTSCFMEWADAPLRQLRSASLVERTALTHNYGGRIHRITDLGREVLKAAAA